MAFRNVDFIRRIHEILRNICLNRKKSILPHCGAVSRIFYLNPEPFRKTSIPYTLLPVTPSLSLLESILMDSTKGNKRDKRN